MSVFFTADPHLGTINIWRRPFVAVAEMHALLLERWNATVGPDDTVWHLGDLAQRADTVPGLLARLDGRKHLLRSNNDPEATGAHLVWQSLADYAELDLVGRKLVLCHYPFRSWNAQHRGAINLHGYSLGQLKPMPRQFDVGSDVHNFAPVTPAQLLAHPARRRKAGLAAGALAGRSAMGLAAAL